MPRRSTCSRLSCFLTQLGRRNLNPASSSLLRGLLYNREKKGVGAHKGNQYLERDQNELIPQRTAERLAAEHGVSAPTIKRDGQFAAAVEALKPVIPDIEQWVFTGDIPEMKALA